MSRGVRRWRGPVALGLLLVVVAVVGVVTATRGSGESLDPASTDGDGARALAQILGEQGVSVRRVTTRAQVSRQTTPGATVLVVRPELLPGRDLTRLARSGADLVLVEPDAIVLQTVFPGVSPAGVTEYRVRPAGRDCQAASALAAGPAGAGGRLYRVAPRSPDGAVATGCYPDPEDGGAVSFVTGTIASTRVSVIGQGELLSNDRLTHQGNAALALRTLGTRDRLVWYLPDPIDLASAQAGQGRTLSEQVPLQVWWALGYLALVAVLAMLWRGRRFGRLVSEPLPVVVRAAETPLGRARLYRVGGARDRAAATLRTATARRLAARLDVGGQLEPEQLAALVAATVRRPEPEVAALLLGPPPGDDAALVTLADELDQLEDTVSERTP